MPYYSFVNTSDGEIRDIFFKMNDVKDYKGEPGEPESKWNRIYAPVNMGVDTKINPFSQKDFMKKTENAKTYGQLWDLSGEMSKQRAEKLGTEDPQRKKAEEKFYKPKKQK